MQPCGFRRGACGDRQTPTSRELRSPTGGERLNITNAFKALRLEDDMMQMLDNVEISLAELRKILPAETATAQAIDRHESLEHIALRAVDDGYIDNASDLGEFVSICLKGSA